MLTIKNIELAKINKKTLIENFHCKKKFKTIIYSGLIIISNNFMKPKKIIYIKKN
jgi:hypothetical protein